MDKIRLSLMLTTALLMTSCGQDITEDPEPSKGLVALQLSSGISVSKTRAFDTTWEGGNAIGVFTTVKGDKTKITKSGSLDNANIGYQINSELNTYNAGTYKYTYGSFTPTSQNKKIYLPVDGSPIDVYAYYPYKNAVSATIPLGVEIPTTQTLTNQKTIDVLMADKVSTTEAPIDIDNPNVELLFNHVMSKVIVYVMPGVGFSEADLAGEKVSSVQLLKQPKDATFAPVTQELAITAGEHTITMQEITDSGDPDYATETNYTIPNTEPAETKKIKHTYRAIILPNNDTNPVATDEGVRQIKFNVGDTYYTYDITEPFESGKQYIFAMRLSATGVEVTAAIKDWSHETITPNPLYPQE